MRARKGAEGVSLKVAKCVMMYALGAEVLPVDCQFHRVTKRLGELEAMVLPN